MPRFSYDAKFHASPLFPPLAEEELLRFEAQVGHELPEAYRSFLLQWNGVRLGQPATFAFAGTADEFGRPDYADDAFGSISIFYGLPSSPDEDDLRTSDQGYAFRERVPDGIWPIGEACSFPRVCLVLQGTNRGEVLYWDPGLPWEEGPNTQTYKYLKKVADSFYDFWQALWPFPQDWP